MKRTVILLMALATAAAAQQPYSTPTAECAVITPGKTEKQQTEAMTSEKARLYASITASRPADDRDARHCHVAYALWLSEGEQGYKAVASFEEDGQDAFGVELVGFSPDKSKVAANFWYAAGDFTAVRPAVYDRSTGKAAVKELGPEVIGRFVDCNYTPTFNGVTNAGEAVVHATKDTYIEEGCAEQPDLLFNLRTGEARAATTPRAGTK